jgi:hypothetical protein
VKQPVPAAAATRAELSILIQSIPFTDAVCKAFVLLHKLEASMLCINRAYICATAYCGAAHLRLCCCVVDINRSPSGLKG